MFFVTISPTFHSLFTFWFLVVYEEATQSLENDDGRPIKAKKGGERGGMERRWFSEFASATEFHVK